MSKKPEQMYRDTEKWDFPTDPIEDPLDLDFEDVFSKNLDINKEYFNVETEEPEDR